MHFIRTDYIHRPIFATNAAGAVVWQQSYDPFGRVVSGSGSDMRFAGQWFAAESGLHQNWMRDYDATLGRYIQPDPLGLVDGASVYGYTLQNPARWSDPRGEYVSPSDNPAEVVTDPVHIGGGGSGGPAWSPIAGLGALLGSLLDPSGGASKENSKEQAGERKAYKRLCTSPPKPTGDYCSDLKTKLDWQKQCLSMRLAYGKKYFGGG